MTTISSPCVRRCCLNEQNICLGCFRSLDEICAWQKLDQQQRDLVLIEVESRRRVHLGYWNIMPT